ncbi:MAG: hypothetical protein R3A47_01690 [Polyangiales bacterium]
MSSKQKDNTDLFSAGPINSSHPPPPKVVLPANEQKRQRNRILVLTSTVLILLVTVAVLGQFVFSRAKRRTAVDAATYNGQPADLSTAMSVLKDSPSPLKARLLAAAAVDGDQAAKQTATALLPHIDANDPDTIIATSLLALSSGEYTRARKTVTETAATTHAAEYLRVRALTELAVGDILHAKSDSDAAAAAVPDSARIEDVRALSTWLLEGDAPALLLLKSRNDPRATILRRRIESLSNPMLSEPLSMEENLTSSQTAWIALLNGERDFYHGDVESADREFRTAAHDILIADEFFTVRLARAFLMRGDQQSAANVLSRLDDSASINATLRALTIAWLRSANGDRRNAQKAFDSIKPDALERVPKELIAALYSYVAARLDATGRRPSKSVVDQFQSAAQSPTMGPIALLTASTLLNDSPEAVEALLAIVQKRYPFHPYTLRVLRTIATNKQDFEPAEKALNDALKAYPDSPSLSTERGLLFLAMNKPEMAVVDFERAKSLDASVPRYAALAAEAKRRSGKSQQARSEFDAVLKRDPSQTDALIGMLKLSLDASDAAAATELLQRIDESNSAKSSVDEERLRLLVMKGKGFDALSDARAAIQRDPKNPALRIEAAWLALQAEAYSQAASYFQSASRYGADKLSMQLQAALAYAYAEQPRRVGSMLDRLEDELPTASSENQTLAEVLRARLALLEKKPSAARAIARRSDQWAQPLDAHAWLLLADVAPTRSANRLEALRKTATVSRPLPLGAGLAAQERANLPDRCALIDAYLVAHSRGELAEELKAIKETCE